MFAYSEEDLAPLFESVKQDALVPINWRHEYHMAVKSSTMTNGFGRMNLKNSDLVMLNEFFYTLRDNLYTPESLEKFLQMKRTRALYFSQNQCHVCTRQVENKSHFWSFLGNEKTD